MYDMCTYIYIYTLCIVYIYTCMIIEPIISYDSYGIVQPGGFSGLSVRYRDVGDLEGRFELETSIEAQLQMSDFERFTSWLCR